MKRCIQIATAILLIQLPLVVHAGVFDSLRSAWSTVSSFAATHAIGSHEEATDETDESPTDDGDEGEESTVEASTDEGMCRVPQQQPETVCEIGLGFLCLNTPEFGVAEDWTIIKGTVDRRNSVVTDMTIVVQHEYTKETVAIDTADPETSGCWESALDIKPFCLDEQGFFAARVPLDRLGPYTVSASASRLSGTSSTKTVRLARVVAPEFSEESLSFDPDITEENQVSASVLNVVVELLGQCQFCDFIGATAGAVTVEVENTMTDEHGAVSSISCSTNVEQGGQGRFVVGVPVGSGKNSLTITVCNAAVKDQCPVVGGIEFSGPAVSGEFEIINPPPMPAYDSSTYPTIDWEFRIGDTGAGDCVNVQFNRQDIEQVCAQGNTFKVNLKPIAGINVATVESTTANGKNTYPWVFGWGSISSPFDDASDMGMETGIIAERSLQIAMPARTMTHVVQPAVSNFLTSDTFGDFVAALISGTPPTRTEDGEQEIDQAAAESADAVAEIKAELDGCNVGGGIMDGRRLEVVGTPEIGMAKMEGMEFEKDMMQFTIGADDVETHIRLVTDADGDGVPEGDPLPLVIGFKKVFFDISLEQSQGLDGRNVFLISSPHTDCDYKSQRYCKGMPAPLIPKNFVGSLSSLGDFVKCDTRGQQVSDETKKLCDAMNSLDAQTGVVGEKVLDALNGALYCTGSAVLTHMLRGGGLGSPLRVGCFPDDPEDSQGPIMGCTSGVAGKILGPWLLSAGVALGEGLQIDSEGVLVSADLRVGKSDLFESIDPALQHPSVGVVVDPQLSNAQLPISSTSSDRLLRLALGTNAINHILFLLTEQSHDGTPSGLLDIDLSEPFYNRLGFDFVEQCDAFDPDQSEEKKPSPLCNIRPRVGELLGTSLTTYKYFGQNQPVVMRLRGNRALTPHVRVVSEEEVPVISRVEGLGEEDEPEEDEDLGNLIDLQIGGIVLKFYALEVDEGVPLDEYGNPTIILDEDGEPVIKSMRPGDPDPNNGQIISFELTMLLAMEIGEVVTDPDDPSRFMVSLRPLASRSRLVLTPLAGSNATTVPPEGLVSALREKLTYAISIFSAKDKAIKLPLPKRIALAPPTPSPDSLMGLLGLRTLTMTQDGLALAFDEGSSFITVDLDGTIHQIVQRDGVTYEEDIP